MLVWSYHTSSSVLRSCYNRSLSLRIDIAYFWKSEYSTKERTLYSALGSQNFQMRHFFKCSCFDDHSKLPLPRRRSQWPRSLRHEPSPPALILGSWIRIPLETWMSMCVYSVCVVLCVGSGLAMGWSPVQGALPTVYRSNKLKNGQVQRAVEP
jgi:hypothetical protein